jgi:hypothetical protein
VLGVFGVLLNENYVQIMLLAILYQVSAHKYVRCTYVQTKNIMKRISTTVYNY